jgi:hypothetical protein
MTLDKLKARGAVEGGENQPKSKRVEQFFKMAQMTDSQAN